MVLSGSARLCQRCSDSKLKAKFLQYIVLPLILGCIVIICVVCSTLMSRDWTSETEQAMTAEEKNSLERIVADKAAYTQEVLTQAVTDLHIYTKFAAGVVHGDIRGTTELNTRNGVCSQEMADMGKCKYQGCKSHEVAPDCGYNFHCLDDYESGLASTDSVKNKQCQKKKTDAGYHSSGSGANLLQCEALSESAQYTSTYFQSGSVKFPYIQSSDRMMDRPGQCTEFNRRQLMEQGQIWALEKDINDATGKRTTSSFDSTSEWYAQESEMPGTVQSGTFQADVTTSRGRLQASSIFDTVVSPLFNYIPRKDTGSGYWAIYSGWDEDGMRVGHASGMSGGTDLDQWMPEWMQSEEDAATKLPALCKLYDDSSGTGQGRIGFDSRCRPWVYEPKASGETYLSPPYVFAASGMPHNTDATQYVT
jgi:hypothetical protein